MEITNQLKKYVRSLHTNKQRQKYNKFIAEGPKVSVEFLRANKYQLEFLFCTNEWQEANEHLLLDLDVNKVIPVKSKVLSQLSLLKTANNILLVLDKNQGENHESNAQSWTLYLDRIQDPGNMGTILRIADWYGIESVLASSDCVSYYNPKVIQAGMGAHNRVHLETVTYTELISNELPKYGLSLDGKLLNNNLNLDPGIIIIGNESKGISSELLTSCNERLTIPRHGGAESLNASVACGISCQILIGNHASG